MFDHLNTLIFIAIVAAVVAIGLPSLGDMTIGGGFDHLNNVLAGR